MAGREVAAAAGWRDVLRVVGLLRGLPAAGAAAPPPSGWTAAPLADSGWDEVVDSRALSRIRGLLAKAESTDFEAEAEALTAKAQELMARHAIDTAMLGQRARRRRRPRVQVQARRLHLDDPHAEAKAAIVQAAGSANGVRVVLLPAYGIATLVGMPGDLDAVELLVTSLLLQAGRALADAVRLAGARGRSTAYRRGFLYSYAQRIEERLTEARDAAPAGGHRHLRQRLAPVLADRQAAVDRAVEELFPASPPPGGRTVDAAGWHAGRRRCRRRRPRRLPYARYGERAPLEGPPRASGGTGSAQIRTSKEDPRSRISIAWAVRSVAVVSHPATNTRASAEVSSSDAVAAAHPA